MSKRRGSDDSGTVARENGRQTYDIARVEPISGRRLLGEFNIGHDRACEVFTDDARHSRAKLCSFRFGRDTKRFYAWRNATVVTTK